MDSKTEALYFEHLVNVTNKGDVLRAVQDELYPVLEEAFAPKAIDLVKSREDVGVQALVAEGLAVIADTMIQNVSMLAAMGADDMKEIIESGKFSNGSDIPKEFDPETGVQQMQVAIPFATAILKASIPVAAYATMRLHYAALDKTRFEQEANTELEAFFDEVGIFEDEEESDGDAS